MANVAALSFDGVNDVVTVAHDAALNLAGGDFTVECWFQDTTGANHGEQAILSKTQYDWLPSDQPYRIQLAFGSITVGYRVSDTWYELSASMPGGNDDTDLHHVAMVYVRSGNLVSLYLDGALAAGPTGQAATQVGNSESLRIGDRGENAYWLGLVDEVRLWNVARSAAEIDDYKDVAAAGDEPNLVACFHFDENTGTTTTDATSAARVGTLSGPTWVTSGLPVLDAPAGPLVGDALTKKALARLAVFTDFLAGVTGKTGFQGGAITEVGIPQARADSSPPAAYVTDVPLWQKLFYEWYRAADDAGLWVTAWASGAQWGDYNLAIHTNDSTYTSTGTNIDKFFSPGAIDVVEAYPAADGATPVRRGVNLAGAEFGHKQSGFDNAHLGTFGTDYYFPTAADIAVMAARRIRTVRLPVSWERLQPTLLGALDATYLGRITAVADACLANGVGLILDLHNYARYEYSDSGTKKVLVLRYETGIDLGNPGPTGEDAGKLGRDYLIDVWRRLSNVYRTHAGVVAYELMNEPHDVAPSTGSFSGTTLNDWNAGTVAGWSGGTGATVSHTTSSPYEGSGALHVSGTTGTAGAFFNLRAERGSVSGTGNVLRGRVRMNGTPTGTWQARFEWQNASFAWQAGSVVTLTPGSWTEVLCDFGSNPIAGSAANLCIQVQSNNPGGSEAVSFDLDVFERGSLAASYTDAQAWEQITQAVLTDLRTRPDDTSKRDTKPVLVPGHGWNVLGWNHAAAWLTEPSGLEGTHRYVTHHYFDSTSTGSGESEGVYQTSTKRYADAKTYAVSQGFTDDGDTSAPTISALTVSGITTTGGVITWTTSEPADHRVEYGSSTGQTPAVYGSATARVTTPSTSHSVTLSGLASGTTYLVRARSRDGAGNLVTATTSFTTVSTGPSVPTGLVAVPVGPTQINLSWVDTSDDETGFELEVSTNGSTDWSFLTTVGPGAQGYSDTGLTANTRRYYRLRAYRSADYSAYSNVANAITSSAAYSGYSNEAETTTPSATYSPYSNEATATTPAAPPPVPNAPSGLVASPLTPTQIALTWVDNSTDETGFSLERATQAGPTLGPFAQVRTLAAQATSVVDTGLTPGTIYNYRLLAFNASGNSPYSNTAAAVTPTSPPPGVAFSGVTVSNLGQTTATVSWRTTSGGWVLGDSVYGVLGAFNGTVLGPPDLFTDSQVEYGPTASYGASTPYDPTQVAQHTQQLTNLDSGVSYHFRLRSGTSGVPSGASLSADYPLSTLAGAPLGPTNLTATTLGPTSISLTWTDNATNETGYSVERAVGAGGAFTVLRNLPANATSDTDTGLAQGTLYRYRVRAIGATGSSAYSLEASATTANVPNPPTGLQALVQSSTQINLSWIDNSTDETSFSIERSVAGGTFSVLTSVGVNVTTHQDTGLSPSTQYSYRVRAVNAVGPSGYSNTATTTPPTAGGGADTTAPVISNVSTTVTSSSFTVNWTTDEPADSQVEYGSTTAYGTSTLRNSALATVHSVTVSPAAPSTLYHYRIRTRDAALNLGPLVDRTVTTAGTPDTTAPSITNLQVVAITSSTATVTWTTDEAADDTVDYGATSAYGLSLSRNPIFATSHARTIPGLAPSTLFHYRVQSQDPAGNNRVSGDGTLTTLAASGGAGTLPAAPANGTLQAGAQVLIALSTRPIETPVWTDVSQWVQRFTFQRGRENELSAVTAATGTVTLDNADRRFDPTNTAGPYYGTLKKMRRVKIRAGWAGAGFDELTGYIEDWPMTFDGPSQATVALSVVDGFGVLSLHELNRPFAAASGDTRVHEVLDDVGWTTGAGWLLGHPTQGVLGSTTVVGSTGDRLISTAAAQLQASNLRDVNALAHIQQVEASELGLFFMAKEGQARLRSRHELQQLAAGPGVAIFGELDGNGELWYVDAQINAAGDVLYNRARIGRENTEAIQQWQDDTSVFDHFPRVFRATLLVDSDEAALGYAQAIVNRYKQLVIRPVIPLLEINPAVRPDLLWPLVLGRELGEVITIRRRPPGDGPVLEQKSRIEGISCTCEAGDRPDAHLWTWQWHLAPVGQEGAPWVLGDPLAGVLGTTTNLVY